MSSIDLPRKEEKMKKSSIQTFYENAGKWSCLASCYIYAVIDELFSDVDMDARMNILNTALYASYVFKKGLDDEFTVYDPKTLMENFASSVGKSIKVNVVKKDIKSALELPLKGYAAVRFDFNGHSHFILFKDQKQYFNSLEFSNCVQNGKITTARLITIERNV